MIAERRSTGIEIRYVGTSKHKLKQVLYLRINYGMTSRLTQNSHEYCLLIIGYFNIYFNKDLIGTSRRVDFQKNIVHVFLIQY